MLFFHSDIFFITKALSFFYIFIPGFVPQWKLSCADTLGQASYQNGSHMRPLKVQKLDCRLRELAQLQINTGNAKKKTCLLVFGYTGVFWSRCSLGASIFLLFWSVTGV